MNTIGGLTYTLSCTEMNLYAQKWKQMNDIAGLSEIGLTSILSMLAFLIDRVWWSLTKWSYCKIPLTGWYTSPYWVYTSRNNVTVVVYNIHNY